MKTRLLLLVALSPLSCTSTPPPPGPKVASERTCTDMGCTSGLELEFVRPSPWPPGSYRITLRIDGKSASCDGELPLKPCDQGASFRCSDASLRIAESGCALPASEHAISGLSSTASEATAVSLVIEHGGALQATANLTPTFQTVQPNGPGCEPVCESASMKLKLR